MGRAAQGSPGPSGAGSPRMARSIRTPLPGQPETQGSCRCLFRAISDQQGRNQRPSHVGDSGRTDSCCHALVPVVFPVGASWLPVVCGCRGSSPSCPLRLRRRRARRPRPLWGVILGVQRQRGGAGGLWAPRSASPGGSLGFPGAALQTTDAGLPSRVPHRPGPTSRGALGGACSGLGERLREPHPGFVRRETRSWAFRGQTTEVAAFLITSEHGHATSWRCVRGPSVARSPPLLQLCRPAGEHGGLPAPSFSLWRATGAPQTGCLVVVLAGRQTGGGGGRCTPLLPSGPCVLHASLSPMPRAPRPRTARTQIPRETP